MNSQMASLGYALRKPEINRLQRSSAAAPTVTGFLKRECFSDLHPVGYRKTISASRRWIGFTRVGIPASARATRGDQTTDRKGREHDHFNPGRHQRVLLRDLIIDLENLTDCQEILTAIGRMDLRNA
jgi:hypothetical protein